MSYGVAPHIWLKPNVEVKQSKAVVNSFTCFCCFSWVSTKRRPLLATSDMSLKSSDGWVSEEEALERFTFEIMQKINARNEAPRHGMQFSRFEGQINSMRKSFSERLERLQQQLVQASISHSLTRAEADRRQRLVDGLNSRSNQMDASLSNPNSVGRNALFGRNPTAGGSGVGWNEDVIPASSNLTAREITEHHLQLIQEQDRGLEALDDIIIRQKGMARVIGTEIEIQNEIIDDITDGMDHTNDRLIRNTRNIKKVGMKSDTCCYWIIIVLLFIAIVVVAVV